MKISVAPYELKVKGALNSQEGNQRSGTLIRVDWAGGLTGYCDFHPLTFKGSSPWEEELERALQGQAQAQWKRSLAWAKKDAWARKQERSLFEGLELPKSHYLVSDLHSGISSEMESAWSKGFRHFKFKLGRNLKAEIEALNLLVNLNSQWKYQLRFDFNSSLSLEDWRVWLKELDPQVASHIEFVEDPLPWNSKLWKESPWTLAADFEKPPWSELPPVLVFKPALGESLPLVRNEKLIFTHIMDHPVGQRAALYEAACYAPSEVGGLRSPYGEDSWGFHEELGFEGPQALSPTGTGWGFDDKLKGLPWLRF